VGEAWLKTLLLSFSTDTDSWNRSGGIQPGHGGY